MATRQIMDGVEGVPEEWQRIGFSGHFTFRAKCDPTDWEGKTPCFVEGNAILLLRVEGDEAVLVRRDDNAIVDIFTGRGRRMFGGEG